MGVPLDISEKLDVVTQDIHRILEVANSHLVTDITGEINFTFTISAPRDVLTDFERAQSVCFVSRYEALPVFKKISITEDNGRCHFGNIHDARHVLNEYRSIIQNKKDSIHYQKIHRFCREKLLNDDHSKDLSIVVNHKDRGDITLDFAKSLDEQAKAIKSIIRHCEFDYIYNGILQHSDHRYTKRFWDEYSSGEINYTFAKHALIAGNIKVLMEWHHRLFSVMTFPKLGPM